jgi:hypothetical protein
VATSIISAGTTDQVAVVRGVYSTTTGLFASSTTGNDLLVQWDADGTGGSGAIESIVLIGSASSAVGVTTVTAGSDILTLA